MPGAVLKGNRPGRPMAGLECGEHGGNDSVDCGVLHFTVSVEESL